MATGATPRRGGHCFMVPAANFAVSTAPGSRFYLLALDPEAVPVPAVGPIAEQMTTPSLTNLSA
jgi:hypothetical protein